MQPKNIALLARDAADAKKAEDPVILDIAKFTTIAHYFVIVHGNSNRHVQAIADHVIQTLKEKKVQLWHSEGKEEGRWILLDFGPVIVHVFYHETRNFYGLERLWGEAARLES